MCIVTPVAAPVTSCHLGRCYLGSVPASYRFGDLLLLNVAHPLDGADSPITGSMSARISRMPEPVG
jgi:hypothetical protein